METTRCLFFSTTSGAKARSRYLTAESRRALRVAAATCSSSSDFARSISRAATCMPRADALASTRSRETPIWVSLQVIASSTECSMDQPPTMIANIRKIPAPDMRASLVLIREKIGEPSMMILLLHEQEVVMAPGVRCLGYPARFIPPVGDGRQTTGR